MEVNLLQTSDPFRYFDLLLATSTPTRRFCEMNKFSYSAFVGLKVGSAPWHATYNRILLLMEMLNYGYRGWVIYMDADAYVADLRFDLNGLLQENTTRSILGAPGGDQAWNINAGILFINLAQPVGQQIVRRWAENFERDVGHERLTQATQPWEAGLKDDQVLLHEILGTEVSGAAIQRLPLELVGAPNSRFIRQLLRQYGTLQERMDHARMDVARVMGSGRQPGNV